MGTSPEEVIDVSSSPDDQGKRKVNGAFPGRVFIFQSPSQACKQGSTRGAGGKPAEGDGEDNTDEDEVQIVEERGPARKRPRQRRRREEPSTSSAQREGREEVRPSYGHGVDSQRRVELIRAMRMPTNAWNYQRRRPLSVRPAGRAALGGVAAAVGGIAMEGEDASSGMRVAGGVDAISLMQREITPADYEALLSLDEGEGSRGASVGAIRACTIRETVTVDRDDSEETRCFCMDTPTLGEVACTLPCGHWFHWECASKWLQINRSCPICKRDIC